MSAVKNYLNSLFNTVFEEEHKPMAAERLAKARTRTPERNVELITALNAEIDQLRNDAIDAAGANLYGEEVIKYVSKMAYKTAMRNAAEAALAG